MNEEEIFQVAADLPAPQRAPYLLTACKGQSELRERIERLLASHDQDAFMQGTANPAVLVAVKAGFTDGASEECGKQIGHYKLLQQIGEGGCGVVYMAQQEQPVRRSVALKIIKLGTDTKSVIARFQQEEQALAMMDHPNIAKVFDAGATDTGRPFFVMELVRGIKITDYCDKNELATTERLQLFMSVCHAIQHAHQKGIIHRDIKPSNILVTLHDGVPVPKVIDFGIAKATTGQRLTDQTLFTAFEQFKGTPAYMSPEQAELSGLDIDTRSDIYSLGVLLYELLTGRTPMDGQQLMALGIDAMRKTIREKEAVRPSTRLSQELVADVSPRTSAAGLAIPSEAEVSAVSRRRLRLKEQINRLRGDLDWIVMKCLEKDRSRRYDTANGLAADLKRHLNNEPVVARPPSAAYKFQKAWRRNRLAFTAAAAVASALVIGISVSTWQAFEASRAQQAEKQARLQADAEKITAQRHLYVANVNLAGSAWEQENFRLLRQTLEDSRTSPDRGFEWYYWQRQARLNLQTLRGHLDFVNSVAFSPDGQRIVTGSKDLTARVWDVASGQELFKLLHRAPVTSVAFSTNGQWIVTGSWDQTARVWDAATGHQLFKLTNHTASVNSVAFSRDGQRIVTGSSDQTAKVWDVATQQVLATLEGHTHQINSVALSPDGKWIVTGSNDRTARVWDAATGRELYPPIGHDREVYSVAFSPDGQRILTGGTELIARLWEAPTGRKLPLELKGRGTMTSLAFSPDGQHIVNGSWTSAATVWDAATGREELPICGHMISVFCVAFSPDGQRIVTGGGDSEVKVWEAHSGRQPLTLQGNLSDILAVAFSPDGQRIVTGTGTLTEDGTVIGSGDQAAQVWDTASGKKLLTLTGHSSGISSVAFSRDGHRIVTGSGDGTAKVWDAATGNELLTLTGRSPINSVAFSPDGQRIVTGSPDQTASVWELVTGRELLTLKEHTAPITSVAFSPDGQWIVTGSWDQTVKVWEAATGQVVRTLETLRPLETSVRRILSVAFSPDSQRIVAGGWGQPMVWDAATGRELLILTGHNGPVSSASFSPDGLRIVTGSYDRTAKLWELATGRELLTLKGHTDGVSSVAFSQDGLRIVTGSWDGTARVWEAARPDQVATWEEEERAAERSQAAWRQELDALLRQRADEEKRPQAPPDRSGR